MHRRQPLPRLWLMTDERQGDKLWLALDRLPAGAGVVFRHNRLKPDERKALFERVRKICRRKRMLLMLAGSEMQAANWGADGVHRSPGRTVARLRLRSAAAHDEREIRAAERAGADLLFLSPAYPTASHPGAKALGSVRFMLLARKARLPVIALGGMDERRARRLRHIYGWAGIDAWSA